MVVAFPGEIYIVVVVEGAQFAVAGVPVRSHLLPALAHTLAGEPARHRLHH